MAALGEKENFFCRLGIEAYFQSRWNVFDFIILFFGWIGSLFVYLWEDDDYFAGFSAIQGHPSVSFVFSNKNHY